MSEIEKLTDQIDRLLVERNVSVGSEYEDGYENGYEAGLLAARELSAAYEEAQRVQMDNIGAVMGRLLKVDTDAQKQVEDARFGLSRNVLDLIQPRPEQTLAEIVAEVVKEFRRTAVVSAKHVCECGCEDSPVEVRDDISSIIQDLKKLL